MSNIKNTANSVDEVGSVNRAQIEHRATWMGLIYDELLKAGLDAEGIVRRAVKRCGLMHGEGIKKKCADPGDCQEFRKVFLSDLVVKTFDMRPINADAGSLTVDFHYCALISAWQKLGFDDKTCDLLCDIAMEGDRGIAEAMGLNFELGDTLAKGCQSCKLKFTKK
ncbi:MAG: L-2-amino-thiazoline-4-carboxylic acid hydrolase [Spirochaetes bacterium]|nr:L-2-amino-thiazoline-4-carboxylic acid hydrolase [Spirochaetota bacterium]